MAAEAARGYGRVFRMPYAECIRKNIQATGITQGHFKTTEAESGKGR